MDRYTKKYHIEKLTEFHRKIHNLHGSSGLYGFDQACQLTNQLQIYLLPLLTIPILSQEHKNEIEKLLGELKKLV